MRKNKIIVIAAVAAASLTILVSSIAVFAADDSKTGSPLANAKQFVRGMFQGDPLERLEKEKANIQQRIKDGKLTREEADKRVTQIDQKIKEIKDFNSLTIEQKKEKLLNDFTTSINSSVKDGKMTQEKADQCLKDFKAKLDSWDGSGNPPYLGKELMGKPGPGFKGEGRKGGGPGFEKGFNGNMDPSQMLEKQKANIQQRVKDGKMAQDEADKAIAKLEEKVKQIQDFNNMTLEQKKEKLLNDFTTSTGNRVKDGKLTQDKANQMISGFKAKLDKWDGTGKMPFAGMRPGDGKGFGGRFHKGNPGSTNQQQ